MSTASTASATAAATEPGEPEGRRLPIVVDLDGTLLVTDTLDEQLAFLLFHRPLRVPAVVAALRGGRAAFKRAVAGAATLDVPVLPVRDALIDWLRARRAEGHALHLVTAADQSVADAAAARVGLFDGAVGSDGTRNLKAGEKRAELDRRFPEGYWYCGDSAADVPVFAGAQGAVLCDVSQRTAQAVAASGTPVVQRFRRKPLSLREIAKAVRVHQWAKNVIIFVPLLAGHAFAAEPILRSVAGFFLLSMLASATYLLNDAADLGADRRHPTKRRRLLASGRLPLRAAFVAVPAAIVLALLLGLALSPPFAATLLLYLVVTTAYSFGLKRKVLFDGFLIGTLFTTRIVMGAAVAGLAQSPWLLAFSMFLFSSLALAKRHVELMRARRDGKAAIPGRGYLAEDWPLTLAFGVSASMISVVIVLLYLTSDAMPSGFYRAADWLYAVPAVIMVWLQRIWLLAHRMILTDDPVVFALRDRFSLALGAAVLALFFLAL